MGFTPYPSSFRLRIRAVIPSPMLARVKKTVMAISEEYELLLNEISIWNIYDRPVPRKKKPAKVPDQRAGLNPVAVSFLSKITSTPAASVIPRGKKI